MKAPSEKHLEDWILANPEKLQHFYKPLIHKVLECQCRFECGIADIVAKGNAGVLVIELKKDGVDEAVIAQCLRYCFELRSSVQSLLADIEVNDLWGCKDYNFHFESWFVTPVVIGSHVKNAATGYLADMGNILIFTYDYDGQGYDFELYRSSYGTSSPVCPTAGIAEAIKDFAFKANETLLAIKGRSNE